MSDNEIYISIQELVFRVSAATRSSMSEEFSDDLIGYGWQVDENAFLTDVQQYVGDKFDDGDILDKEMVEQMIYEGLFNLENFMLDFYEVNYEGENEQGEDEEFTGSLKDCLHKFNIPSFKKEWKLEELSQNWNGYEDYIFNDSESEESYEDIFDKY
tara:strand:+ start:137 stop:607 length:471 start_codon:yes stop_codon:yes gene_type:complete